MRTAQKGIEARYGETKKTLMGVIQTLALTVEAREPHFTDHQKRVASLARCMAEEMGLSKERITGSGYPDGLIGEDMLLEAKILGVDDVVDAMTSYRFYRNFFALDEALQEILQNRGIRYDFNVVRACLAVFREKGFTFAHEYYSPLKSLEEILLKV